MSQKSLFTAVVVLSLLLGFVGGSVATIVLPYNEPSLLALWSQRSIPSSTVPPAPAAEDATVRVVRQTSPAVVSIVATRILDADGTTGDFFDPFAGDRLPPVSGTSSSTYAPEPSLTGAGSGFFVRPSGMIVTNRHVVDDKRANYTVVLQDGSRHAAEVVGIDTAFDLAFLKIEQVGGAAFPFLLFGDSEAIEVGQPVIAIGNALAEFDNTVTKGVVSGIHRRLVAGVHETGNEVLEEAIQTDAAINPGNSGGPLLNMSGEVIGINTAVSEAAQSLGFALPALNAKHALESIEAHGRIVRPWLGIRYVIITPEMAAREKLTYSYGVRVAHGETASDAAVIPSSPAAKAGIKAGDIVLLLNGQRIDAHHPLSSLLLKYAPTQQVQLRILREGTEQDVTVTLDERQTDL